MSYAVYTLALIGVNGALEAEGIAHWACSQDHAQQLAAGHSDYSIGPNSDALPDTVCEVCGATL